MFFQVIVVTAVLAFVAVATLVGTPVLRKVMVRAAERKYAVTFSEALKQAEFCGKMGYLFRAGDYDDILSVEDVLAVNATYLESVRAEGYRVRKEGFPNNVEFMEFYALNWDAEVAFSEGMREGLYAL